MPSIAIFTLIAVTAASMAKAVPIDDFSSYDNQLSQVPAFNDGPNWQDSNDAATKTPQFLALDPCADPNVRSPPNCPTPKISTPTPAPEEVQPPPTIKTYGGSIQGIFMEYPWNICGGRNPEPRPIATCSSGNPQETVFKQINGDPSESYQLEHSFIYYPPPDSGCPNDDAELWCCWQFVYEEPAVQFSRGTGVNCLNTNHMFQDITADVFPNHYGYAIWPRMKYVPVYKPGDPYRPSVSYPQLPRT